MIKVRIKDTETNETTKCDCEGIIFAGKNKNGGKVGIVGGFSIVDLYILRGQIADAIAQTMKEME